jgi:hypothetical protein
MPIDVQGNVCQQMMGRAPDLGVVMDVEEAVNVHGASPPRTRRVG